MSDSVQPHRRQPARLSHPWDSPGKNIGVGCHFLLQCMKVKSESEVAQSCPTLSDPRDCSLLGSSVHGIFQARVLAWVPLPSPLVALDGVIFYSHFLKFCLHLHPWILHQLGHVFVILGYLFFWVSLNEKHYQTIFEVTKLKLLQVTFKDSLSQGIQKG